GRGGGGGGGARRGRPGPGRLPGGRPLEARAILVGRRLGPTSRAGRVGRRPPDPVPRSTVRRRTHRQSTLTEMTSEASHDVVVIGGGVAGVTCALECFDIQLDTTLIEANATLGGQLPEIGHSVRNVAAGRFAAGRALQGSLLEAADILAGRVRLSHPVSRADLTERVIEAGGERIAGRAVVLATGTRRQFLEAAPDGAFDGDVTYQVEPRLDSFAGRDVAGLRGGGRRGVPAPAPARRGAAGPPVP